jgi:outer membrane protein TolC
LSSIQKNIDIQKIQVDIQTKYAYDSLNEPMNSNLTLQDLQNKIEDSTTNLEVNLWKAYYTLKNKEDTVQSQLVAQESAQLSYDKANESFNNGMIDKVSLDSAELNLNTQKVSTQQSINDYMVTQEEFNYALNGHASTATSIQ